MYRIYLRGPAEELEAATAALRSAGYDVTRDDEGAISLTAHDVNAPVEVARPHGFTLQRHELVIPDAVVMTAQERVLDLAGYSVN